MNIKNYSIHTKKFNLLISSLHALFRLANMNLNQEEILKRLVRLTAQVLDADFCCIILCDTLKRHALLRAITQKGEKSKITKKRKIKDKEELQVLKKGDFIFKDCFLVVPLIADDIFGFVKVKRTGKDAQIFNATDRQILVTFSEQMTISVKHAQLLEEQRKLIKGTVKSLVSLYQTKTEHAYEHTACFNRIVMALAQKMKLNEAQQQSLYFASLLHDAGKAEIPLKILAKRNKLTGKEFSIIKTHPLKGVDMIKHLNELKPVMPIILHHHERFDGSGYPSGLKKGQIPIGARIMAIADAFEAVVFGRPYKNSLTIAEATEEIKNNSGTQFDPKVVEAFLSVIKRKDILKFINKCIKEKFAQDKQRKK